MKFSSLVSPRWWWDTAVEQVWRQMPPHAVDRQKLTWKVEPEALDGLEVLWPSRYNWKPRKTWGDQVMAAFRRFVPVRRVEIPQPFDRVICFGVARGGRSLQVNVETSDYPELHEEAYENCDLHFKMEFSLDGYGERDHLLPGGYVNGDADIYAYLNRLRALRDRAAPLYDVYGRYSLSLEKRRVPLEILNSSKRVSFYGGVGKVRYSRYLAESARAKVCLDLPSMSSITFRMIDLLAMGSCIVGPPHTNQLLMPLQAGVHVAYCKPDYSDLEEVCASLLAQDDERARLVRNSRAFFDAYVHREQMASYYLHHLTRRI